MRQDVAKHDDLGCPQAHDDRDRAIAGAEHVPLGDPALAVSIVRVLPAWAGQSRGGGVRAPGFACFVRSVVWRWDFAEQVVGWTPWLRANSSRIFLLVGV